MDFEQLIANQHDIFNQLCDDEKCSNDKNNNTNNNSTDNSNQNHYSINGINDTNNNYHSINDKNGKNNDTDADEDDDDENSIADCSRNYNKTKHNHINSHHALDNSNNDCNNSSFKSQSDDGSCPSVSNQPSVNRYCNTEEALTPNLDDILNEAVNDDENFHFDFDNHVLPPCFDSLIINAEDQLLNSPHLDILKLESPQPFDGSSTQESPQDYASTTSEENVENEENETLRSNEQSYDDSNCCDSSHYLDVSESNPSPESTLPEGLTDCERAEVTEKAMSETEIQLIREVNKTLDWDCILPVKKEDSEEHGNQEGAYDHTLEPLQEVPCLEDYYKDSFARNQSTDDLRIDPKREICFEDDVFNDLPLDFDDVQALDIYGSDLSKKPKQEPSLPSPSFPAPSPSFIKPEEQEAKKQIESYSGENSPRNTIRSASDRQSHNSTVSPAAYKVESQTRREKTVAARHRRQGFHSSLRHHAHKQATPRKYVRNIPHVYNRNIVTPNHEAACAAALGYNRAYAANFHHHHHHSNSLPHMYNNMMANNYGEYPMNVYDKRVFRRVEPRGMGEANFIQGCPTGIYNEAVEAQLHHDVWSRGEDFAFSRDALDVYLPNEQDVIRRYIVGDKRHVPVPPFSGEIQQLIKRERKKHKNRVAASKCRKKKLEREAQLEVRVNCLKDRSAHLTTVARELRNQATGLKQKIVDHINAGCTLNPNVLPMGMNQYYM